MNIEDYFISDEFFDSLKPIAKFIKKGDSAFTDLVEYFISIAINYSILFRDGDIFSTRGLSNFVKNVANKIVCMDIQSVYSLSSNSELKNYVSNLYIDELLSRVGLSRESLNDENYRKNICSYIIKNLIGKKYMFHAFNSSYWDSILANGIDPNIRFTSQYELDVINELFERKGISMIFGWQKLNCVGQVSFSMTPSISYYYGVNSPEWFAQFTGQGFPFNPADKYEKNAYVKGNYEAAKNNLLTLMEEHNFSSSEQGLVIDFFEKNWKIYANKNPILAIIPDSEIDDSNYWINSILNDSYYKQDVNKVMGFCLSDYRNDCQSEENIDVSNAIFVKLPRYDYLVKKLSPSKKIIKEEGETKGPDEIIIQKLMTLANSRIKIALDSKRQEVWISDRGEEEVNEVRNILKDNDVYRAIVKNQYDQQLYLDGWIRCFDSKIINSPENIKLLAVNKPFYFSYVSEENRNNIELMRKCACQRGIHPVLVCYVGEKLQNDFEFISNLIMNSDENTFDFYDTNLLDKNDSNLCYSNFIGINIRSDPKFWQLLNSKIVSINENSSRQFLLFSIEKELELVRMSMDSSKGESFDGGSGSFKPF